MNKQLNHIHINHSDETYNIIKLLKHVLVEHSEVKTTICLETIHKFNIIIVLATDIIASIYLG